MLVVQGKSSKLALSLLALLNVQDAFSGTMGAVPVPQWHYVAAISAGPVWQNAGETQTIFLTSEIEKAYVANSSSNVLADVELFLGLQKLLTGTFTGQLGVALAATSKASLNGVIWDDGDPEFNNHIYSYRVQHRHIAIKGKLLSDMGYFVIPWVSASAGVGSNRASSFSNTPIIFEALPNRNFASHTETAFTFTLGAGVQKELNENLQIGIGYEFADWGKSQLGRAEGQTLGTGLSLNHFYTNGVMVNLTFIA